MRDFHDSQTCVEFQAALMAVVEVAPCPSCSLQLTNGDGLSTAACVCGARFDSSREVGKVFEDSVQRRAAAEGGQGSSGVGAAAIPKSLANAAGVQNPPPLALL